MSVGRFFCRMMAVVLCLMIQLPLLVMPAAMVSAADMPQMTAMVGEAPMMGHHAAFSQHSLYVPAAPPVASSVSASGMGGGVHMRSSHAMVRMLVRVQPASSGMRMGDDAVPCCQSHHGSCDAGLLPAGPSPAQPLGSKPAFQLYALRLSLRSSIVPPWRPPAVMPV